MILKLIIIVMVLAGILAAALVAYLDERSSEFLYRERRSWYGMLKR
jgi:hypothetical protein